MTVAGVVFELFLFTRGKSYFRTRKPVRAIEFYVFIGCADYVLLNNFYIDFLLAKIGTFKLLRVIENHVHVRVVL